MHMMHLGDVSEVESSLRNGASANALNKQDHLTPLQIAVQRSKTFKLLFLSEAIRLMHFMRIQTEIYQLLKFS